MALSEAKKASNKKSDQKYMQILIKPYKAEGAAIREAAAAKGQSLQAYILQAVRERMGRDGYTFSPNPDNSLCNASSALDSETVK